MESNLLRSVTKLSNENLLNYKSLCFNSFSVILLQPKWHSRIVQSSFVWIHPMLSFHHILKKKSIESSLTKSLSIRNADGSPEKAKYTYSLNFVFTKRKLTEYFSFAPDDERTENLRTISSVPCKLWKSLDFSCI